MARGNEDSKSSQLSCPQLSAIRNQFFTAYHSRYSWIYLDTTAEEPGVCLRFTR